ncbi:MAG: DNA polymerase III subunit chi [Rickettsiaceae bacterium]
MIKISCYKTIQEKLPKAFCMLAEKCYHNNIKVFVYTNSKEYTLELDRVLWTYSKKQYIPHSTIHDLLPEKQPILIGSELRNLNNSSNMIIVNASESKILSILLSNEDLLVKKCERLFFLYDRSTAIPSNNIKNIIAKSSLDSFKFESYIQDDNNSWQVLEDY